MRATNRRRFLLAGLGAGGALGASAAGWLRRDGDPAGCDPSAGLPAGPDGLQTASKTAGAFGTRVKITALHVDRALAGRAIRAALAEIELVERLMSLYRPESQLSRLNRHGVLRDPHPCLVAALRCAERTWRATGGAFDATVQPLWALYAEAHRAGRLPDDAEIAAARRQVDGRQVEIASRQIRLCGRGTTVTLNGIAQGIAADRAAAALRRHGVRHALVDAGEIGPLGQKSRGQPWTVGIQHPRHEDGYVRLAGLRGRCLATSGDYATTFSDDFRHHHVFDPRTGDSPQELASVSVVAPTATQADALATALLVLPLARGDKLLRSTPGVDALFVLKDGTAFSSAGFPSAT